MPIYEFYCSDTNKIYSFFSHGVIGPEVIPSCPENPDYSMVKRVSGFAVVGKARETGEGGAEPDLDDPRMEAAMAEMEREMAGMDEENPDPRQMGHLMRRMSELTGEKMPDVMEEMVGRLEAGEDPDKLEEEFGDLSELEDFGSGEAEAEGESSLKKKLFRRREPARDPQLYELRDFI